VGYFVFTLHANWKKWKFLLKRKTLFSRTFHFGTNHPIAVNSKIFFYNVRREVEDRKEAYKIRGGEYIN
jgi:hypothetical protein